MRIIRRTTAVGAALLAASLGLIAVVEAAQSTDNGSPPWESEFVVWPRHEGLSTSWKNDARIAGLSPDGYPDDFPVLFENPDPAFEDEIMWVTIIDYYAATDEYLGILLNAPYDLNSIEEGDSAVFRYDPQVKQLRALTANGSHRYEGVPQRARTIAFSELWEGIRQYRLGAFGHNLPAIEQCIAVLSPATQELGELASTADRYLFHFVLGRCHAEAYNTDAAIEAFRKALTYDRDDVDAHMALLAEYSLKVHPPVDQPMEQYDASWEPLFLQELVYVREHFPEDRLVTGITSVIFDESRVDDLSEMSAEEIARHRRFGFGTIRWKRH